MSDDATAVADGCEDAASIRVTLPPTATEAPTTTASATDDTAQLAGTDAPGRAVPRRHRADPAPSDAGRSLALA